MSGYVCQLLLWKKSVRLSLPGITADKGKSGGLEIVTFVGFVFFTLSPSNCGSMNLHFKNP